MINITVELMDGLNHNGLDHYTHLLTGYVGSPSFLKQIAQVVQQLRKINPNLVYGKKTLIGYIYNKIQFLCRISSLIITCLETVFLLLICWDLLISL